MNIVMRGASALGKSPMWGQCVNCGTIVECEKQETLVRVVDNITKHVINCPACSWCEIKCHDVYSSWNSPKELEIL